MAERKKPIKVQEVADQLAMAGHRVHAIGWTADPEKRKEVFRQLKAYALEVARMDLPPEERRCLVDGKAKELMAELEESGLDRVTTQRFRDWPPPAASKN
jgi:hypothetical protein